MQLAIAHQAEADAAGQRGAACGVGLAGGSTRGHRGSLLVVVEAETSAAAEQIAHLVEQHYGAAPSDYPMEALRQALIASNHALWQEGQGARRARSVCAIAAALSGRELALGMVGGGAAWLQRGDELRPLLGRASESSGQFLGSGAQVEPQMVRAHLVAGDVLLLASPALHEGVEVGGVVRVLAQEGPEEACAAWIALARARGCWDAVATIVARVMSEERADVADRLTLPLARTRVELDEETPEANGDLSAVEERTWDERPPVLSMRERALEERAVALAQAEAALEGRERSLAEREQALQAAQATLLAWERALAERQKVVQAQDERSRGPVVPTAEAAVPVAWPEAWREAQEALRREIGELSQRIAGLDHEQELMRTQLEAQKQELLRWVHRLGQCEAKLHCSHPSPSGAGSLSQGRATACEREILFTATTGQASFDQEEAIALPDGTTIHCGLTAHREHYRRQYPVALEVWVQNGAGRQARLLVGFGLDLRSLPAGVAQRRGLAVIVGGGEAVCFPMGDALAYAAIRECRFATVARDKVARDYCAFRALRLRFQVVWGT